MKLNLCVIITCCLILFSTSCKKNGGNGPSNNSTSDIYITGGDLSNPVYWKNGQEVKLTLKYAKGSFESGIATSMVISNNDVYVVGQGMNGDGSAKALYWKNGVLDTLQSLPNNYVTCANSILISNGDIYIGGSQEIGGINYGGILWKNGIPIIYSSNYQYCSLISSNGNIYASGPGSHPPSTSDVAHYFKNGSEVDISSDESDIFDLTISGNDIYAAGAIGQAGLPCYWKNGVIDTLTPTKFLYNWAKSISVSGSDVYVIAYQDVMWKNGISTNVVPQGVVTSYLNQITAIGKDVYIVGENTLPGGVSIATMWKNNIPIALANRPSVAYNIYFH